MELADIALKVLLAVLTIAVGAISYFLKGILSEFNHLKERVERNTLDVQAVEGAARSFKDDTKRIERDVEKVAARQDRHDERMTSIQRDLSSILSTLSLLAEELPTVRADLTEIRERLARMEGKS